MSSSIDPNNISLLAFLRLSREENLTTQSFDDLVTRLGTQALAELKVLTDLERSRLRFALRGFEPIVSPNSSTWLQAILTSNIATEAKEGAKIQRKVDEALKAEFEEGLQKWLETEQSNYKHQAAQRISEAYDSNATELVLGVLKLTSLPPEIGQLVNLQVLYLENNNLTELPATLGQLINQKVLYLGVTKLTELPPFLGQLTNLKDLYLSDNNFSELPCTLRQLTNLKELYLRYNHVTEFPSTFVELTNLRRLDLDSNELTDLPATLGQLTNLEVLYLGGNKLTELPPFLGQLTHLQELFLYKNQLTKLPATLGQLTNLKVLELGINRLTELPATLGQLTNLRYLHLARNQLKELPATLGQLTNLAELFLDENQLTELPPTLGQLSQLLTLLINNNPELSDLPISLGNIPGITDLDIRDTCISIATREAILAACKSARACESYKKLPQTLSLWKTKAGSQTDFSFLTKDPILSAEKLGGLKEVSQSDAMGPLAEGSLRVQMNGHLYDITIDGVSELWKIEKGSLFSKLQEGTYLEEGSFSRHQQAILYEWLVRLSKTSDYSHSQKPLAERVCQILAPLKHNPEFRERFFILADAHNERCGDRAAMSLNEIYTAYLLMNLPKEASTEDKLKLLVGLAKTYTLRDTLAKLMENQSGLEESVEIFLAKETTLKSRLGLVTAVETMHYEQIGQKREWLNDDDLVEAVNANFFDQLFRFEQFQKLMNEDPEYKAKEQEISKKFAPQMEELEKNIHKMSEQDYVVKGKKLAQQKEIAFKELAQNWFERRIHV